MEAIERNDEPLAFPISNEKKRKEKKRKKERKRERERERCFESIWVSRVALPSVSSITIYRFALSLSLSLCLLLSVSLSLSHCLSVETGAARDIY